MCFHVFLAQLKCCSIIKECDTLTCILSQTSTHYCPCSSVFLQSHLLSISSLHVHLCWSLKLAYNGSLICFQFFCTTFHNISLRWMYRTTTFPLSLPSYGFCWIFPLFSFIFIDECAQVNKMILLVVFIARCHHESVVTWLLVSFSMCFVWFFSKHQMYHRTGFNKMLRN